MRKQTFAYRLSRISPYGRAQGTVIEVIRLGRVTLVPAGDQAPAGRRLPEEGGRLVLDAGDEAADRCSVAADHAELIETPACGLYLRVGRPTLIEAGTQTPATVAPGLYQVIRKPA